MCSFGCICVPVRVGECVDVSVWIGKCWRVRVRVYVCVRVRVHVRVRVYTCVIKRLLRAFKFISVLISFLRADEETNKRLELERTKRELENQIEELKEDLEAEKSSRVKAEKQRKSTSEVCFEEQTTLLFLPHGKTFAFYAQF